MAKTPRILTNKIALTGGERLKIYLFLRQHPTKDRAERRKRSLLQAALMIQNNNFFVDRNMVEVEPGVFVPREGQIVSIGKTVGKKGFFREVPSEEENVYDFTNDLASYLLDLMEGQPFDAADTEIIARVEEKLLQVRENRYEIPDVKVGGDDDGYEKKPYDPEKERTERMAQVRMDRLKELGPA